jgi:hypothetical protein
MVGNARQRLLQRSPLRKHTKWGGPVFLFLQQSGALTSVPGRGARKLWFKTLDVQNVENDYEKKTKFRRYFAF